MNDANKTINEKSRKDEKNKILIGLDWLQYSLIDDSVLNQEDNNYFEQFTEENTINGYYIKNSHRKSKFFTQVFEVWKVGEKQSLALIESRPSENFLPVRYCMLKIENYLLYRNETKNIVKDILENFKLKFRRINRIDVFIDCNHLDDGKDIETFLEEIATNKIRERRKRKMTIIRDKSEKQKIEYLRLGSITRRTTTTIYNKSKEMQQRTFKPYIQQAQEKAGLEISKDVWRIEFSTKRDNDEYIDTETGERINLNSCPYAIFDHFETIFKGIFARMFVWARIEEKKQFKDFELVTTFNNLTGINIHHDRYTETKSNKTDKTVIKKLCLYAKNQIAENSLKQKYMLKTVIILVNMLGLQRWFDYVKFDFLGSLATQVFLS